MNSILVFGAGLLLGAAGAYFFLRPSKDPVFPPVPLKVELTHFRMKPGTEAQFKEWMAFQREHHEQMVATLDREKMVFESIFLDERGDGRSFYWLSVEGPGGESVASSPHAVDHKHVQFAKAVIEKESKYNLATQFILMPDWLEGAIRRGLATR